MPLTYNDLTLDQLTNLTLNELASLELEEAASDYISPVAIDVVYADVTGQIDVDIIAVSDGRLTLYKLALSVYQGTLAVSYNQFTPICQWTPNFYFSNNKLYLTGGNADVVQVGIRYTILGSAESNGASSSGGVA